MASKPQQCSCLPQLPSAGIIGVYHHVSFLRGCWEIQTQYLCSPSKHLTAWVICPGLLFLRKQDTQYCYFCMKGRTEAGELKAVGLLSTHRDFWQKTQQPALHGGMTHSRLWTLCFSSNTSNHQWTLTFGFALGFSCSNFLAAASMDAAAPSSSVSAMTVGSSGSTHSVPKISPRKVTLGRWRHEGTGVITNKSKWAFLDGPVASSLHKGSLPSSPSSARRD